MKEKEPSRIGRFFQLAAKWMPRGLFQVVDIKELSEDPKYDVLFQGECVSGDELMGIGIARKNLNEGHDTGMIFNDEDDIIMPDNAQKL